MTALTHHGSDREATRTSTRTSLREALGLPLLPADVVAAYRPRSVELTRRIVERIRAEVAGFAAQGDPKIHLGIDEAIRRAVELFVDTIAGAPTQGTEVFTFYQWVGSYQSTAGLNLDAMRAAHQIATQESWTDLQLAASELGQSAEVVSALGAGLLAYQKRLFEHAVRGFARASARARRDHDEGRAAMLVGLLRGTCPSELAMLAERCSWTLPDEVVVAVTRDTEETTRLASTCTGALSGVQHGRLIVVAAPDATRALARDVADRPGEAVSLAWSVPPAQTHLACRWASRGLSLLQEGVISAAADGLVEVEQHQDLLCTHADPALRRLLDERELAPLLAQTPKRRMALAETLLLWLQTHHSAPALASELGVHDQTVRHRLRRLRDLFGSRLEDPTQTATLLNALESSMLRWRRAV